LYGPPQKKGQSQSQPQPQTNTIVSTQNTHLLCVVFYLIFYSTGLCNVGLLL
jgi:hypothetical protein